MMENYEAPWDLKGKGIILPFLSRDLIPAEIGFFSEEDSSQFSGGAGAIMLVSYESSNVGPYFELLYIPGNFKFRQKKYKRITKIYVSSELSVEHGRKNWGIPKELADFEWEENDKSIQIEISKENKLFFSIDLKKHFFPFPIHSAFYPITLLQKSDSEYLTTQFRGKGIGHFCSVNSYHSDKSHFPAKTEISNVFLPGIYVNPFYLTFPVAGRLEK